MRRPFTFELNKRLAHISYSAPYGANVRDIRVGRFQKCYAIESMAIRIVSCVEVWTPL